MKILLLSFYYEPDATPGAFRSLALVDALSTKLAEGDRIDVLTTVPNRFSQRTVSPGTEIVSEMVHVTRFPITEHAIGMVDQSLAFSGFARQALSAASRERYDIVVSTTARLMTGVLGDWVAHSQRIPHYVDIRDIFSDVVVDLFRGRPQLALLPLFRWLERRVLRRAARVNLVSPGFLDHHAPFVEERRIRTFTNGVDHEFASQTWHDPAPRTRPRVLYAGNIGEGQGLHRILPQVARATAERYCYRVFGVGGRYQALIDAVRGLDNVELRGPVARRDLMDEYSEADILFLHLNDFPAFRKVLPSKIFEYAATGKPMIAGVSGYAADFIKAEIKNAEVFDPGDLDGMLRALGRVSLGLTPRDEFMDSYRRSAIMSKMADDILSVAGVAGPG